MPSNLARLFTSARLPFYDSKRCGTRAECLKPKLAFLADSHIPITPDVSGLAAGISDLECWLADRTLLSILDTTNLPRREPSARHVQAIVAPSRSSHGPPRIAAPSWIFCPYFVLIVLCL